HARVLARKARRGLLGVLEDEARGKEQRLGVLLELGARRAGAHAFRCQLVAFSHKKTRASVRRAGFLGRTCAARFSWIYCAPASCGPSNRRVRGNYIRRPNSGLAAALRPRRNRAWHGGGARSSAGSRW